jgi:hypothetical protein
MLTLVRGLGVLQEMRVSTPIASKYRAIEFSVIVILEQRDYSEPDCQKNRLPEVIQFHGHFLRRLSARKISIIKRILTKSKNTLTGPV